MKTDRAGSVLFGAIVGAAWALVALAAGFTVMGWRFWLICAAGNLTFGLGQVAETRRRAA